MGEMNEIGEMRDGWGRWEKVDSMGRRCRCELHQGEASGEALGKDMPSGACATVGAFQPRLFVHLTTSFLSYFLVL